MGTSYLMCSDGLINEVPDSAIEEVLVGAASPQDKADALVAMALDAGSRDNVSIVIATIYVTDGEVPSAEDDTNPRGGDGGGDDE